MTVTATTPAIPGTRWNTASGLDTSFGSDVLAQSQTEDLAQMGSMSSVTTDTAMAASATITAAQLINGIYVATGAAAGAITATTDTAANIVAAIPNCQVGSAFDFWLNNLSGQTATLTGGTGVAQLGQGIAAITTAHNGAWKFVVTNATKGSEAVKFIPLSLAVL
jgi:hypothetical protein